MKLLGNASHHAYSFGQANMAQRAIQRLDEELTNTAYIALDTATARRALTELQTSAAPDLAALRAAIEAALREPQPPAAQGG
ncbi:MAG: hypothetical protein NVSMB64_20740 [Candidatus Velthaea sp.]